MNYKPKIEKAQVSQEHNGHTLTKYIDDKNEADKRSVDEQDPVGRNPSPLEALMAKPNRNKARLKGKK